MKNSTTLFSFLVSLILVHFSVYAQDATYFDAFETDSFTSENGGILPYRLLKPLEYDADKKYPLVIFLHGSGERGEDNSSQLKNAASVFLDEEIREKYPAFVLAPQCPENDRWSLHHEGDITEKYFLSEEPSETMKLLMELIQSTQESYNIDEKRLYVTGLSMGGQGVYDLLLRNSDTFAAAVVVCSFTDIRKAGALVDTPIWIFHGEDDNVVPVDNARVMVNTLDVLGAKPRYTEYTATGHNSWDKAFSEEKLFPWLFKKKL
ncbi:prolyl oligopeptidase family serine peptidase [Chondrinema litorale]|uniref:carboxylesterase family protein n=1 Tax=Chondrinema litorale TaxID=2994555 RepID=UPI00254317D0|nr:prolyl oligopeptidase family serine peptidase [Chondrinema litorale]UZR94282.1 prolyl oligopeptidase family serine peptidase [Chondrinema litorale]